MLQSCRSFVQVLRPEFHRLLILPEGKDLLRGSGRSTFGLGEFESMRKREMIFLT